MLEESFQSIFCSITYTNAVCFYDKDDDFVCLARDARKQIRKTPVTLIRHRRPPESQDTPKQIRGRLKSRRLEGSRRVLSVLRPATGVLCDGRVS